ncbi:MAG: hypothetical protein RIQ59_2120 [Bacteroidota bacterium]|jgi:hypothetical protein
MKTLIFLSHIHEESELAIIIQSAIEDEFSGFVDVFVSSDGKTIPAGANFLKRIDEGLINCIGAIYLISPISVKRNWINFELGAVWIRNVISTKNGGPEIPTIPFCHSGISPGQLPMPLINLSAIQTNNSSNLEIAFKSIQLAVGGKGNLKTDFDKLASAILKFERNYTIGENLLKLFKAVNLKKPEMQTVVNQSKALGNGQQLKIILGFRDNSLLQTLRTIEDNELNGLLGVQFENPGMRVSDLHGAQSGGEITLTILTNILIDFETKLITNI